MLIAKKIAIVTTHPIQYYAPLFKLLSSEIELKVFYTWGKNALEKYDPGFGKVVEWDIPLLEGYNFEFVENTSKEPGSHHFKGIKNPTLINDLLNYHPSEIMVIGWGYQSHLKVMRYFKGKIPIYFRGDSTLLDNGTTSFLGRLKSLTRRILLIYIYSHVNKVFYVGIESKLYFKWALLKESQLIFSPHSIDNKRFEIDYSKKANDIRSSLLISNEDILILFAGKFESKKNPLILLQAFLNALIQNVHLVFVGNGQEEQKLKELANQSTKGSYLHFVDFQNQSMMPIWYQACDIFCLPSQGPNETWGLAVNEAMASGKAIIVSNKVGCSKDLVIDKKNGWIFKSGNERQLTSIIENLPSKVDLKQMGENSKKLIESYAQTISSQLMLNEFKDVSFKNELVAKI